MLSMDKAVLKSRTRAFEEKLREGFSGSSGWSVEMVENTSVVGGGSAPGVQPASWVIAVSSDLRSDDLAAALRRFRTPVVSRIHEGKLLLDLRTVFESQEDDLFEALVSLV